MFLQVNELLSQIKSAIGDLFVAKLVESEEGVEMCFLNGQTFLLTVKEK